MLRGRESSGFEYSELPFILTPKPQSLHAERADASAARCGDLACAKPMRKLSIRNLFTNTADPNIQTVLSQSILYLFGLLIYFQNRDTKLYKSYTY
jgi:hypothetical protein